MADNTKVLVRALVGVVMPTVLSEVLKPGLDAEDPENDDLPTPIEVQELFSNRMAQLVSKSLAQKMFGA
ncbi:hypothetical protein [Roseateles sp.]|jgi:hypothetical protein|uniref:hypothetical protein n=1 Tax=Roseateles sp. TaxID=1971397 RepID=UPI0021785C30|nr:hypothetical protein [Rubrivivax sp.]MCE2654704.1 hypothetical protein [Planctomycetaceae bacterium]MCZ8023727.1 hypothetical protein [Cytophagales bacterium]